MLITDGVEENEDEGRLLAVEVEETEEEVQGEISVMSLQQLGQLGQMGTNKPQSIQLKGTVQGVPVLILVDSGATHNFVDKKLVKKMNWAVADTPPMCIKLGDGSRVQAKRACQGMEIEIGGVQIEINAQLFDLGGVDVVLGVEWLSTLGDTIMNWRKHTMSFWYNKEWITFQGLNDSMETLNSILSSTSRGGKGWLRRMGERVGEEDFLNTGQQRELEGLLSKYEIIFQEPKGLPPRRKKEHMINLKESHEAVNVIGTPIITKMR
jgi:hypothetical protein